MSRVCSFSLFLLTAVCVTASAQEFSKRTSPADLKRPARPPAEIKTQQKQVAVYFARGLGDKINALGNAEAKIRGAAQLADLLWKDDETYSRALFEASLALTEPGVEIEGVKSLPALRRGVIMRIAKHHPAWAKRLIDEMLEDAQNHNLKPSALNIDTALRLLEHDAGTATEFATRSLQGGIDPALVQFIKELRRGNRQSADQLFLQTLSYATQAPAADANQFALLGTYLFTSPQLIDSDDPTAVVLTRVGGFLMPDITADRPDAPRPLVRAYLEAAVNFLSRRHADPNQAQSSYALGYLLLPKAGRFAPELVAPLGTGMSALQASVPPELTQDAAYAYLHKRPSSLDERLRTAEDISDPESRDLAYLDIAHGAWQKHDFKTARAAAAKINKRETTERLSVLNDFGESAWLLKRGPQSLPEAERFANRLPPGVERSLLFLGIAQAALKSEDKAQAQEAVAVALKSARAVSDARRPFITLAAAGKLAAADPAAAPSTLAQAVKEFNALSAPAPLDWQQRVESGPLVHWFQLRVSGVDLSFEQAFGAATAAAPPEAAVAQAEGLRDEKLRAQAFVQLAAASLRSAKEGGGRADARVIRVGEDGIRKSASKVVMPAYPEEARKRQESGVAVIELQYNGKGDVTEVLILEAPARAIGQAVSDAAKQWKFNPSATADGVSVSIRGKLTFYFVIDKDGQARVENPKQFR